MCLTPTVGDDHQGRLFGGTFLNRDCVPTKTLIQRDSLDPRGRLYDAEHDRRDAITQSIYVQTAFPEVVQRALGKLPV